MLKISTKGRYALEALTYMSANQDKMPINIKILAEETTISERYLEQIFLILRKAGILSTKRGPGGGYFIAVSCDVLKIGDVIRVVEGEIIPVPCVKGSCNRGDDFYNTCKTRDIWKKIAASADVVFDGITLADLASKYNEMRC